MKTSPPPATGTAPLRHPSTDGKPRRFGLSSSIRRPLARPAALGSHDRVHARRATSDRSPEPSPVKPYTAAGRPNERRPPPRRRSASVRRQRAGPTVTGSSSSPASRRRAAAACSARSKTRSRCVASSTPLPTRHRKTRGPHAAMLAQPRTFHPIINDSAVDSLPFDLSVGEPHSVGLCLECGRCGEESSNRVCG